jgi:hypothetical protein
VYRTNDEIDVALRQVRVSHVRSGKEIIRHAALKLGASSALDFYAKRKGFLVPYEDNDDPRVIFGRIYSAGGWVHSSAQESRSGLGSSMVATSGLFEEIHNAMRKFECRSLVDVGCGDWNWMSRENILVDYTGIDVVPSVIGNNAKHSRDNIRFLVCDVVKERPPEADMVLCREVLFHLSFADIKRALVNLAKCGKYICATTDTVSWFNSDIWTGGYRTLNLFRPPFRLPRPVFMIDDSIVAAGRFLAIWKSEDIPEY